MENKLSFSCYLPVNQQEFCGIFTTYVEKKTFYRFYFQLTSEKILGFEFFVDKFTKKAGNFFIYKLKKQDIKVTKFCVKGGLLFTQNNFYKNYSFLIDFAYEKYGLLSNEKSYENLNNAIYFLFYLYCLNELNLDCTLYGINPNLKQKNMAFFNEIFSKLHFFEDIL